MPPLPSLSAIVERVMPAVVNISVSMRAGAPSEIDATGDASLDRALRHFFERNGQPDGPLGATPWGHKTTALGSGFIVDPNGHVVTNNHLVADADRVTVILQRQLAPSAHLVGEDDATHLALLKIDAPKRAAPSRVGEQRPGEARRLGDRDRQSLGLGSSVTAGIVWVLGLDIDEGPYDSFIQIDAPINPGNSAGPIFDLDGEVIGINSAIFSPSGGSMASTSPFPPRPRGGSSASSRPRDASIMAGSA